MSNEQDIFEMPSKGTRYWTSYRGRMFHLVEQYGDWHAFESGATDVLAIAKTLEGAISAAKHSIDSDKE